MKILYINHYAGTLKRGMEFRPYYMARSWIQEGAQVLIVASNESHVRAEKIPMKECFHFEKTDGVDYLWCKTNPYQGNGLGRVLNIFYFLFRLFQKSSYFIKDFHPQIVIASSTYPLDIFPAWWIAKRSGAQLVFEVHDLWPLSPMELGGMPWYHPFIVLLQIAENFACRFSDAIVSMLPCSKEHLVAHGMKENKFNYVPNGIDFTDWSEEKVRGLALPSELSSILENCQSQQDFTVAYLGAHGLANKLENLLDAADILQNSKAKVKIFLVGSGPDKDSLKRRAQELKLSNVIFIDAVPKTLIPVLTTKFDALYIGLKKQSLFRFGISPNKLMDYMAAGRPIINSIEAGNDPVAEAQCGISIPSEDAKALAKAILQLQSMTVYERNEMGLRGKDYVLKNHDYTVLAKNFLNVFQRLLK